MRLATLRRFQPEARAPGTVHGRARVDPKVRNLVRRARPGDIAVVDLFDLDGPSADLLVAARVAAVVNAAPSISGRYPNLGPQVLIGAGVQVLDRVGPEVMRSVADGDALRIEGDTLVHDGRVVARGERLTEASVAAAMAGAHDGLGVQLQAFAGCTVEHLRQERDLLLDGAGVPRIRTALAGRPVLVASGAPDAEGDLTRLRAWVRGARPVLVGVDEGGDLLLDRGMRPDLLVGNPDFMSDRLLGTGAELVVHVYRDGRAPGLARAENEGLTPVLFPVTGTSEDAALLLAHGHDAALVVRLGAPAGLAELVDQGRADLAGSVLTRLRVGSRLVDAAAVARVYRRPAPTWPLLLLVVLLLLAAAAVLLLADAATPVGQWRESVLDAVQVWAGRST